ncbi:uncharacterized protein BDZ99DRAFT_571567 [Mytilinidion resinicola]|uniref:Uncharacterized protein n=1 Tax=Mytilinidion resinicola TaxID=574789 RepID=A0A6A6YPA2_9PEZI|nr:uncharacterized protein BDZ99DRAFT_571567 [Mytilinidion resinicola]KAF2809844.1 hypothetical protein BDZ99DRAFT_571567 [Mytilinidion resinicola]
MQLCAQLRLIVQNRRPVPRLSFIYTRPTCDSFPPPSDSLTASKAHKAIITNCAATMSGSGAPAPSREPSPPLADAARALERALAANFFRQDVSDETFGRLATAATRARLGSFAYALDPAWPGRGPSGALLPPAPTRPAPAPPVPPAPTSPPSSPAGAPRRRLHSPPPPASSPPPPMPPLPAGLRTPRTVRVVSRSRDALLLRGYGPAPPAVLRRVAAVPIIRVTPPTPEPAQGPPSSPPPRAPGRSSS